MGEEGLSQSSNKVLVTSSKGSVQCSLAKNGPLRIMTIVTAKAGLLEGLFTGLLSRAAG